VALVLPSIALLPAAILGFESGVAHSHRAVHLGAEHDHAAEGGSRLAHSPFGPNHPVNHDCAPCQVIKYLATSYLPPAALAALPLGPVDASPSDCRHQPQDGGHVAVAPPIRAPPYLFV